TTLTHTPSLHDALPISFGSARRPRCRNSLRPCASTSRLASQRSPCPRWSCNDVATKRLPSRAARILRVELQVLASFLWKAMPTRSEEHTSELQSRGHLV